MFLLHLHQFSQSAVSARYSRPRAISAANSNPALFASADTKGTIAILITPRICLDRSVKVAASLSKALTSSSPNAPY